MTEEQIVKLTEKRLRDEVSRGVQTIQYQVVTLLTTNGQAPFVTVFMYLNEAKNEQEKKDLALIIEETLKQRIQGVKNEDGVWITPAFPKLIYVLEEDNIKEGSSYFYLTELAAKCTAKRMVPDYISEKVMKQLKGDVYTCMGCRSFLTPDRFTDKGIGNIAKCKNPRCITSVEQEIDHVFKLPAFQILLSYERQFRFRPLATPLAAYAFLLEQIFGCFRSEYRRPNAG